MDDATLTARLEEARRGLLDLSTRNRLLALPKPAGAHAVANRQVADEADPTPVDQHLLVGLA